MGVVYAQPTSRSTAVALKLIAPAPPTPCFARASSASTGGRRDRPPARRAGLPRGRGGRASCTSRCAASRAPTSGAARAGRRLEPDRAVDLIAQVGGALDAAHRPARAPRRQARQHPLARAKGGEQAFLTDFGLAKRSRPTRGLTGRASIGTPDYMSPEQARGAEVDGARRRLRARLRALPRADRRGAVRPRQRPGEAVGAPERPAAVAARGRPELRARSTR